MAKGTYGRYFRRKPSNLIGTSFDSQSEKNLWDLQIPNLEFKGVKIPYTIQKTYNPDFTLTQKDRRVYVEVKGFFQDSTEASKYIWVREVLGPNEELVFIFDNPETPIHYLKKRKDGSRLTLGGWAESNGFKWYTLESFKEEFTDV